MPRDFVLYMAAAYTQNVNKQTDLDLDMCPVHKSHCRLNVFTTEVIDLDVPTVIPVHAVTYNLINTLAFPPISSMPYSI